MSAAVVRGTAQAALILFGTESAKKRNPVSNYYNYLLLPNGFSSLVGGTATAIFEIQVLFHDSKLDFSCSLHVNRCGGCMTCVRPAPQFLLA
jgi:hypothetical protein